MRESVTESGAARLRSLWLRRAISSSLLDRRRLPFDRIRRKPSWANDLESDSHRRLCRAKLQLQFGTLSSSEIRHADVLLLNRNAALSVEYAAQLVTPQYVRRERFARTQLQAEARRTPLDRQRLHRARLCPKNFVRGLVSAIDVNHTVHSLLKGAKSAVPDMRAIVVVTEENCPGHKRS